MLNMLELELHNVRTVRSKADHIQNTNALYLIVYSQVE